MFVCVSSACAFCFLLFFIVFFFFEEALQRIRYRREVKFCSVFLLDGLLTVVIVVFFCYAYLFEINAQRLILFITLEFVMGFFFRVCGTNLLLPHFVIEFPSWEYRGLLAVGVS